MDVKRVARWMVDPSTSLNSWGVRLIIAAMVALLLSCMVLLVQVLGVRDQLAADREERETLRARNLDRTCLILDKLGATAGERMRSGCP
jgi:low affinity Fe/Cu permease